MEKTWESKAALYELLAKTFLFTQREIVGALTSGEYQEALAEVTEINDLPKDWGECGANELNRYRGKDEDEAFHRMRKEYTRLYIGSRDPLIIPFAGTWEASQAGWKPLLFVGKKSMEIERFMRTCGIVRTGESNDPLDHIGSMLEFIMHLCMLNAGLVDRPAGVDIPDRAYEDFYEDHFIGFARAFAEETIEKSSEAFFTVGAQVLRALPDNPL
ncbi:TorD/DmsD family molecular chaperone [Eggerthella sinensis]|uniref:TorD/DmsD family molecular chaperone n=1 Tax=Eggerthella sinensis TaxID=242230 RepID=UPI001D06511A|nr:molecular chaperone TorD family protein [Eggerthella sinensis]MCB7036822.1 molecular chaperone TorD family protein [Eggerthella sinensis]